MGSPGGTAPKALRAHLRHGFRRGPTDPFLAPYGRPVRRLPAALAALAAAALTAACSGSAGGDASPTPTYDLPPRPVRVAETPLPYHPVADGLVTFTAIGIRTGMDYITGTHADLPAKGAFIRIRVIVDNGYSRTHTLDTAKQLLVAADGSTRPPDVGAMEVERQPDKIDVGAHDRLELDLYYDIPKGTTARAIRFYGAPSDDAGNPIGVDRGVQVPLS
jgi:hypothetical protein